MGRSLRRSLQAGVGCAPSCWPIFGFRNLLGARRGTQGQFFCAVRVADFPAEGASGEPPQGVAGELGGPGACAKEKIKTARIPVSILACLLHCRDPQPAVHFSFLSTIKVRWK